MDNASLPAADARTFLPDDDPRTRAAIVDLVGELGRQQQPVGHRPALLTGPDGASPLPLPAQVHEALLQIVEVLSQVLAVTVAPQHMTMSTYEAANLLGVSRSTMLRLLGNSGLPPERVKSRSAAHRQVRLEDVLAIRENRRVERRRLLTELTTDSVDAGMYDKRADEFK
ncbi:hypothetical protein Sme01_50980 [Sphaerisporangium melleum]|uniref:Helix-turn-helix domain-containing protein n=1 Tax=Sphaerisporangium melleum TaxID=321316 RepID=A0A917VG46_9ACTN|nr:excisionase [Sphaerisporangium melleum]GGK75368.1 hypothetical protein GCM10007964_17730 [Sphaerisporangium melleum]GII72622.1 hypothetical protein Sme01_50980 [Sphaerisporangium melleum]